MTTSQFGLIILGMGVVTYVPRLLPLILLSRKSLPKWLIQWLDLIPAAILGALLLPELITAGHPRQIEWLRPELIAAFPTFVVAAYTRSLGWTVIAGMVIYGLIKIWVMS